MSGDRPKGKKALPVSAAAPTLLTRREAAAMLRLSLDGVDKLVREGRVPFYKAGRQHLFRPEEVLAALRVDAGAAEGKGAGTRGVA